MPQHRKQRKFRRVGRHAAPGHTKVVTQKAGRAVPAVAIVGVLAVATQSHRSAATGGAQIEALPGPVVDPAGAAALLGSAGLRPAKKQRAPLPEAAWAYTVQPGDTLSGIALRFYGQARAWPWLYQANRGKIGNPNLIFPGQVLSVPRSVPASFVSLNVDAAGAARPWQTPGSGSATGSGSGSATGSGALDAGGTPAGTLGCSGLEALWRAAGGAPSAEVTAGSVAMAESGGSQYATGTFGERGYWQINPDHGSLSTYSAYGNARAAVIISGDGTNWSPWTTYVDGAYAGRC